MRSLLDVNVLIALIDPDHVSHAPATTWWLQQREAGWASCPLSAVYGAKRQHLPVL